MIYPQCRFLPSNGFSNDWGVGKTMWIQKVICLVYFISPTNTKRHKHSEENPGDGPLGFKSQLHRLLLMCSDTQHHCYITAKVKGCDKIYKKTKSKWCVWCPSAERWLIEEKSQNAFKAVQERNQQCQCWYELLASHSYTLMSKIYIFF